MKHIELDKPNDSPLLSERTGELVAKVSGSVWVENLYNTGREEIEIITPEGRTVITPLMPKDVCELIQAFLYQAMREIHKEEWEQALISELELWLQDDCLLTEYGKGKWQLLIEFISSWLDFIGYGDAKH